MTKPHGNLSNFFGWTNAGKVPPLARPAWQFEPRSCHATRTSVTTEKRENGEPSVATAMGLKVPGCAKTPASSPEAVRPRVKRLVAKGQIGMMGLWPCFGSKRCVYIYTNIYIYIICSPPPPGPTFLYKSIYIYMLII